MLKKTFRILFYTLLGFSLLFLLYTIYSFISVRGLCKLQTVNPGVTAFMQQRMEEWKDKQKNLRVQQEWVPLSQISRHLKNAVLEGEDPNFYRHHGFDFEQIRISMQENWEEKRIVRGASTITQQLMKNLYLSPSQNPFRKWREAILTYRVEHCVKKDRLLEIYLNVIEWGESVYGIQSAARYYFGKPASALSPSESALLAAMIPNPVVHSPYKNDRWLARKKYTILRFMLRDGKLTRTEYQNAIHSGTGLRYHK